MLFVGNNWDGTAHVIDPKHFTALGRINVVRPGPTPRGLGHNSGDGRYYFVSVSGDDRRVVLDYRTEREVARIGVGHHPRRMRTGVVDRDLLRHLPRTG